MTVVVVEQIESEAVLTHDGKEGLGFISGQVFAIDDLGYKPDGLIQLGKTPLVRRVALGLVMSHAAPGGPDTELGASLGVHPVAHRDDGVKVEILYLPLNRAPAFFLNCCKECNSCLAV